jgi:cytochrome P450
MLSGVLPFRIKSMHDEYGSIIRVAPDELSFIDARAWKDIYSHKTFIRPKIWGSRPPGVEAHNVISAPIADHARFRKAFQPTFAERATREHETTVQRYIDTLISKLRSSSLTNQRKSPPIDLMQWLNFTTFDIISDISWGSDFGCLKEAKYHPFIKIVLHFKAVLVATAFKYYPWLEACLMAITPKSAMSDLHSVLDTTHAKVKARLANPTERRDMISHVLEHNKTSPEMELSQGEIEANSMAIIVGGSETLTTVLVSAIHHLLKTPDAFDLLAEEIRLAFSNEAEITAKNVSRLYYLNAVLSEVLRISPPLPDGLHREVPKGGAVICGHHIPEGMTVSISCYAAFHSSSNFASPDVFAPERWLSTRPEFENDNEAIFQPFATGPHGCLGQPLAWMEMRIILVRLIWNFQIDVPEGKELGAWDDQKIFWTWEKQPLEVRLLARDGPPLILRKDI